MKKAIGYVRVSTTQQDYLRQENIINEYCKMNGLQLVNVFADKKSGASNDREGLKHLMDVSKDDADIIVLTEVSRLSRSEDIALTLGIINEIIHKGIEVCFINNNPHNAKTYKGGKVLDVVDIITLAIELDAASKERQRICLRMQTGKKTLFANNPMMCCSKVPFGYMKTYNKEYKPHHTPQTILVRDSKAQFVPCIFQWCADGYTLGEIVEMLKQKGLKISRTTIYNILHSPIYKGIWTFDNVSVKGDALVSAEIWEKVQMELRKHAESRKGEKNFHLLKGVLKCHCGCNMTIARGRNVLYYKCTSHVNPNMPSCDNHQVREDVVNKSVWFSLIHTISASKYMQLSNEEIARIDAAIQEKRDSIAYQEKELQALTSQMEVLGDRMANESDDAIYKALRNNFAGMNSRADSIKATIKQLQQEIVGHISTKEILQTKASNEELQGMNEEQRQVIIKRYIKKVTFESKGKNVGLLSVCYNNAVTEYFLIKATASYYLIDYPINEKLEIELSDEDIQEITGIKELNIMDDDCFLHGMGNYEDEIKKYYMQMPNEYKEILIK